MNQCGRCNQGVAFAARVGNVKLCTPLRHGRIDRQDTAFEPSENLMVDPGTQDSTLRRVLARDQPRPKFDFENRDGGDEEARRGDRVPQAATLRSVLSGRLSSEITLVSRRNIS
jgi:hypothetical protein